uniref:Tail assembly chaperone n=1 Tax=Caulobacter phage BL57 TaxID=3348355 RepID=A0AB74ULH1_9VIRU
MAKPIPQGRYGIAGFMSLTPVNFKVVDLDTTVHEEDEDDEDWHALDLDGKPFFFNRIVARFDTAEDAQANLAAAQAAYAEQDEIVKGLQAAYEDVKRKLELAVSKRGLEYRKALMGGS